MWGERLFNTGKKLQERKRSRKKKKAGGGTLKHQEGKKVGDSL